MQGGESDTDRHPWLGVAETRTTQVRETGVPTDDVSVQGSGGGEGANVARELEKTPQTLKDMSPSP